LKIVWQLPKDATVHFWLHVSVSPLPLCSLFLSLFVSSPNKLLNFFNMALPTVPKLYNTYFLAIIATIGGML